MTSADRDHGSASLQFTRRIVESGAYSAECSAAALYLCQGSGDGQAAVSIGGAFRSIHRRSGGVLIGAMRGLEEGTAIYFGGDWTALDFGLLNSVDGVQRPQGFVARSGCRTTRTKRLVSWPSPTVFRAAA